MAEKPILFTQHSLERIEKRGLSKEWVIDIIRNSDSVSPLEPDRTQEFRQQRKGSYYFAVVEQERHNIRVITAGECGQP